MFVVVNLATMMYYNPTLDQECPRWVYLCNAIGLFLYQTFDALDGAQARRTGQSGPLGELFDHCVDALNTTLEVIIFAGTVNLGYGWAVIASQFATLLNFYLSTWEEYHTGTLFLSSFSGPVEGILIVIGFYVVTFFTGPSFWHERIIDIVNIKFVDSPLHPRIENMTLNDAYLVFASIGLFFNIHQASSHVIAARRQQKKPLLPVLIEVMPFAFFYATLFVWIWLSPSILYEYLMPLVTATGIAFAFTVGRMITAHVTNQSFPLWNPLLLMPALGVAAHATASTLGWDMKLTSLSTVWAGLGLSLGIYGSFISEVIYEITTYLDIGCLYIKYPKTGDKKTK